MAMVPAAQSLRVSEIRDPAALFERYNTEEIRAIERKVRGEIEQKKEELRQMVGERYRDLIDAADTIGEMRQCSESVVLSIQDMYRYCSKLKQGKGHAPAGSKTEVAQRQSQEKFFCMAAQIKLLLEIPEHIWSSMEASQYLRATQLYLLCCHLHGHLHLEAGGPHYSPVLARFPILVRQVAAAGHFRSTILLESKSLLRGRAVSDQAIADALASTMLLEGSSPRQALADFLLARKASIQQLLNQPQHGAGIKTQVCSLVELLVTTLYQAYAVFYLPPEGTPQDPCLSCGLLFSTLEGATSSKPAGGRNRVLQEDMAPGGWFRYLPPSVTEFQPALRSLAQPIQREQLRDSLQQWIDTCKEDIRQAVGSLLVYVKSLKALASIRDAVWDLLASDSVSQNWAAVCQRLLGRPLAFWEDFLQRLFLQRLQALAQEAMDGISAGCRQLLSTSLQELEMREGPGDSSRLVPFEGDVASFLWSESPGDLPTDAAWVSAALRGAPVSGHPSGLAMKARAVTPRVQAFCASLDARLRLQLDDLQHYLPLESEGAPPPSAGLGRFADAGVVEETLRLRCLQCIREILALVGSELDGTRERGGVAAAPPVLFMARLCQSVAELCPNLQRCILGNEDTTGGGGRLVARPPPRQGKKLGKAADVSPAQTAWAGLKEELLSCSMEAYRVWSSALCQVLVERFASQLHADSPGSILESTTTWEELEIQEEAESGSSVTSKIRLPVQPSWHVQSLLFHLCLEVNRVGGHALPPVTLQELLRGCLGQVLGEYEKLVKEAQNKDSASTVTQNRALQLLFDLRHLSATLGTRPDDGKVARPVQDPRVQDVCDSLESFIDPFDLDVFTVPLNSNLIRLAQRTSVLLGLLSGPERPFTPRTGSSGAQDPSNILPLASSQFRFGLLPLSMTTSRKAKSITRGADVTRPLATPTTAPSAEESFRPGSLFRQLANQEEESATPSLFKLSWLSGMAK
ncbi:LOW QUALITY PROTEIN: conserved oligomeric Golgi complex subunit 1 [Brienomyrus brachyistius]|uniref:LOW QUALITY PROTEIN: conserved oligomeric Golgi complex subunit 1 n=1 Tax=Brienomyrus brachyistius TaxID=42636 RepID=UPI0020B3E211|nr:LOW QUALITY PROTEIN: conserved oligomeric Golgi complex subunit 1 [Brienomyrus brachyistius]